MALKAVTDSTFKADVLDKKDTYILVDFWAEWCGPCRMVGPVLEAMSKTLEGQVEIVKLDTDSNPMTAQEFHISSIPCNILFKNGQEVHRFIGFKPQAAFEAELKSHLN